MSDEKPAKLFFTTSDLVSMGFGTRQTLRRIVASTDFPKPLTFRERPKVWHRDDVLAWLEKARANALRD